MISDLASMRRHYEREELNEEQAPAEPYALFHQWLAQAIEFELPPLEPNAMVLSSVDRKGRPHGRVMLLKEVDAQGFVFFSHYRSAKGQDFAGNPQAALTFFWPVLERQVRIEGLIERIGADESDRYYRSRPLSSRLSAWTSEQSQVIPSRGYLQDRLHEVRRRYGDSEPARPDYWGGYRLKPDRIEFWQGGPGRLHDRLNYLKTANGWKRERLAP
jgi:pyridoxamine 5'-phosphate oxidase